MHSQKGTHVRFVRIAVAVTDIVPRDDEIAVGTVRSILNQAHIGLEEWEGLA